MVTYTTCPPKYLTAEHAERPHEKREISNRCSAALANSSPNPVYAPDLPAFTLVTSTIHILGPYDTAVLERVAPDVFDNPVDSRWAAEFLADSRHHLAVAVDGDLVIGMASALHYVHPDKPPELWINEVAVTPTHRGQGIGRRLLAALFDRGCSLGCRQAWVLTSPSNAAAHRMYSAAGGIEESQTFVMVEFELKREGGVHQIP